MPDIWESLLLLPVALLAGTIGGTVGFGSSTILIPVCALIFGAAETVPILTVAGLIGNLSRFAFSWRETDHRAAAVYAAGAIPASALGALVFIELDAAAIQRLLGLFLLFSIPMGRLAARQSWRTPLWQLCAVGIVMGLVSGMIGVSGPINAPFFLGYGLVKGAYLATEAFGAAAVHLTKSTVYGRFGVLNAATLPAGLAIGLVLIAGSYLGKRIVNRMDGARFRIAVEITLAIAGTLMLAGAG